MAEAGFEFKSVWLKIHNKVFLHKKVLHKDVRTPRELTNVHLVADKKYFKIQSRNLIIIYYIISTGSIKFETTTWQTKFRTHS